MVLVSRAVAGAHYEFVRISFEQANFSEESEDRLDLSEDCLFAMKKMPEEGQVLCLTTFDPSLTRDGAWLTPKGRCLPVLSDGRSNRAKPGSLGNISARLRSFLWKVATWN